MKSVQIQSGDDLYSIAEKYLGDQKYWRYVSLINNVGPFDEFDLEKPIQIPDPAELQGLIKAIDSRQPEQILSAVSGITGIQQLNALGSLASGKVDPSAIAGTILDLSGLKGGFGSYNILDWII